MKKQFFFVMLSLVAYFSPSLFSVVVSDIGIYSIQDKGEDFFTTDLRFNNDPHQAYLALFDGHGGKNVASLAATSFESFFQDCLKENDSVPQAIEDAFHAFDKTTYNFHSKEFAKIGSTALLAYINNNNLYVANLGDCRAVLFEGGEIYQLSRDHKPDLPDEKKRIEEGGGMVIRLYGKGPYRVEGELCVSRSFGDFPLKHMNEKIHPVENTPEIQFHSLKASSFLLLASDGLWDVCQNSDAVSLIENYFDAGFTAQVAAKALASWVVKLRTKDKSLGTDDITVMIAKLDADENETYNELNKNFSHKRKISELPSEDFNHALKRIQPFNSLIQTH